MKVQINAGALVGACERYIAATDKRLLEDLERQIQSYMVPYTHPPGRVGKPIIVGWWLWKTTKWVTKTVTYPEVRRTRDEAEKYALTYYGRKNGIGIASYDRAVQFRAIAKHKNPNTLLEITDPELEGIAPYLSEFSDPNGRIE